MRAHCAGLGSGRKISHAAVRRKEDGNRNAAWGAGDSCQHILGELVVCSTTLMGAGFVPGPCTVLSCQCWLHCMEDPRAASMGKADACCLHVFYCVCQVVGVAVVRAWLHAELGL